LPSVPKPRYRAIAPKIRMFILKKAVKLYDIKLYS
jgi:hypothetical protein